MGLPECKFFSFSGISGKPAGKEADVYEITNFMKEGMSGGGNAGANDKSAALQGDVEDAEAKCSSAGLDVRFTRTKQKTLGGRYVYEATANKKKWALYFFVGGWFLAPTSQIGRSFRGACVAAPGKDLVPPTTGWRRADGFKVPPRSHGIGLIITWQKVFWINTFFAHACTCTTTILRTRAECFL